MRVVVAPDKFAGTLSAVEAAEAIASGWSRRAPGDELVLVPMSDGGPGFVDVLHAVLGGELLAATVAGPYGEPVPAAVLLVGRTAYLESAQAVGLALTPPGRREATRATSVGVGELVRRAAEAGARRIVVGLGGSGTNDGGAGLLHALGARTTGGRLDRGPDGLAGLGGLDLEPARSLLGGVELVAATDVENPLLGLTGATRTFGPQKGLDDDQQLAVDARLQELATVADRKLADAHGAGAAGGLGYALLLLGGRRVSGVELVAGAVGLADRARGSELVLTGEGSFDFSSRGGKVPLGVASIAVDALAPCVVLAGQVHLGAREMRSHGVEAAYSVAELVGSRQALADPAPSLAALAERVARTWSR